MRSREGVPSLRASIIDLRTADPPRSNCLCTTKCTAVGSTPASEATSQSSSRATTPLVQKSAAWTGTRIPRANAIWEAGTTPAARLPQPRSTGATSGVTPRRTWSKKTAKFGASVSIHLHWSVPHAPRVASHAN